MMKPYGNENIDLKITYRKQERKAAGLILGCLLAVSFLLAAVWCLQGGLRFAGDLGSFLNLVLDRLAERDLRVHDEFAAAGGVSGLFLLAAALCAIVFAAVVCFSLEYRLWPVLWALPVIQTVLQLWLPGCPWPVTGLFYLIWVLCVLWAGALSSGGGVSMTRLICLGLGCAMAAGLICLAAEQPRQSLPQQQKTEEKAVANLPQGDFSELQALELGDETVLKLTMDRPESYYLKGYTGEVYTGSGWESLDGKTLSAENDLFYWLHKQNFWAYGQMEQAAALVDQEDAAENTLKIEFPDGARTRLLLPYEARGKVGAADDLIGDTIFKSKEKNGVSAYTLEAADPLLSRRSRLLEDLRERQADQTLREYLLCENSYRDFVYRQYTALDQETEAALEAALGKAETLDTAQVKAKILKLLAEFDYDENITYSSEEGDFLSVFLQDKAGWSVHFATASALMFRYYGIPARYAEGYLVTPEDVKGRKAGETITLDSGHAHSWMEYYEDGLGWVPFETTGPYIGVMGSDDSVSYSGGGAQAKQPQKQEKKQEKEQKLATLETAVMEHALWILSGLALLLLILLVAAVLLGRRRAGRKKGLRIEDDRQAVVVMMGYILAVMEKRGMPRRNLPMSAHETEAARCFGEPLSRDFRKAAAIYEAAVYSGRPVKQEDRDFVARLVKDIKKKTRRKETEL